MTAYAVVDIEWHSMEKMNEYFGKVLPMVAKNGGRYLVAGPAQVLEGTWKPRALAVVEFPTMEALQGFYDSAEYAPLMKFRKENADTHIVVAEGFVPPH
jgi:uncharacterized protein (DUF1330 family)